MYWEADLGGKQLWNVIKYICISAVPRVSTTLRCIFYFYFSVVILGYFIVLSLLLFR